MELKDKTIGKRQNYSSHLDFVPRKHRRIAEKILIEFSKVEL